MKDKNMTINTNVIFTYPSYFNYCPNCGRKRKDNDIYCSECGRLLFENVTYIPYTPTFPDPTVWYPPYTHYRDVYIY